MDNLVSVIITTYGSPQKLSRAIQSALDQSYVPLEVIVVDDNTTGDEFRIKTEESMVQFSRDSRVKYLKHEKNRNGAAARNTGIQHANGEFITFLDSDDFLFYDRIQRAVDFLKKHPNYGGVLSSVLLSTNGCPKKIVQIDSSTCTLDNLMTDFEMMGTGSNLFFIREVVENVGNFNENFPRFQDVEYMIRVMLQYNIGKLDEVTIVKENDGIHSISYTKLKKATELFLKVFHDQIEALEDDKKRQFYLERYNALFYAALNTGNITDIEETKAVLYKYRKLTQIEMNSAKNVWIYRKKRTIKKKILEIGRKYGILSVLKKNQITKVLQGVECRKLNYLRHINS